jgi:hypothetical protein
LHPAWCWDMSISMFGWAPLTLPAVCVLPLPLFAFLLLPPPPGHLSVVMIVWGHCAPGSEHVCVPVSMCVFVNPPQASTGHPATHPPPEERRHHPAVGKGDCDQAGCGPASACRGSCGEDPGHGSGQAGPQRDRLAEVLLAHGPASAAGLQASVGGDGVGAW